MTVATMGHLAHMRSLLAGCCYYHPTLHQMPIAIVGHGPRTWLLLAMIVLASVSHRYWPPQ
jgi:hypothetical protein